MGIIQRQSFKNSILTYVGVLIGTFSTIFIYPLVDKHDWGMVQFMADTAKFFAPIAAFASSLTVVNFFPQFKDENKQNNGFFFFMMTWTLVSSLCFIALAYLFQDTFALFFKGNEYVFIQILPFILFATVLNAQINFFQTFISLFNRIAIPTIFVNLFVKIGQPILILLYFYGVISLFDILRGLILIFISIVIALIIYTKSLKQLHLRPNFTKLKKGLVHKMLGYSSFNLFVSLGGLLAVYVDKIFVTARLGFDAGAIFNVPMVIAEAIDVPRKAISGIASPLISDYMTHENYLEVEKIYQKSALTQLIAGVFLLAGAWACADALYDLMPKNGEGYRVGKWAILVLGLARIVDMATGTNAEIITYSKYYRFNFISLTVLAVLNISLNLLLIDWYGIIGSAIATLISMTIVNSWRLIYLKNKIGIQPLSMPMLIVLAFGFTAWLVAYLTPSVSTAFFGKQVAAFLNILSKGLIITLLYGFLVLKFQISEDLNSGFGQLKKRFLP
jgi:O-antigen/teichoic acid export membrane protein